MDNLKIIEDREGKFFTNDVTETTLSGLKPDETTSIVLLDMRLMGVGVHTWLNKNDVQVMIEWLTKWLEENN